MIYGDLRLSEPPNFHTLRTDHSFDVAAEYLHRTITAADYDRVILLVNIALQRQGEPMPTHSDKDLAKHVKQLGQLFSGINDRVVLLERAAANDQHKVDAIALAVKRNRSALSRLLKANQPPAKASEKGE
jgi:hypothetical protein